jgi:hypothetical protein
MMKKKMKKKKWVWFFLAQQTEESGFQLHLVIIETFIQ